MADEKGWQRLARPSVHYWTAGEYVDGVFRGWRRFADLLLVAVDVQGGRRLYPAPLMLAETLGAAGVEPGDGVRILCTGTVPAVDGRQTAIFDVQTKADVDLYLFAGEDADEGKGAGGADGRGTAGRPAPGDPNLGLPLEGAVKGDA